MGKHRKNTHYRRIVIAAVAVGTVGIPSAAVACTDWPGGGGHRSVAAANSAADSAWNEKGWWNDATWGRPWNAGPAGEPSSAVPAATKAPTASASATRTPHASAGAGKTTAPKRKAAASKRKPSAPSHTARTTAPKPRVTASPSTRKPTTAPSTAPSPSSTPKPTATASGAVARVVELVNAERGKVGCSALTLNTTLSKVAQAHSEDMARHQNMSHTGSDGSAPGDRITSAGYTWSAYGENVAYGYASPEQVMAGWMASPGHKANILNCAFKEIGVGLAQPGSYWTQDFATAR